MPSAVGARTVRIESNAPSRRLKAAILVFVLLAAVIAERRGARCGIPERRNAAQRGAMVAAVLGFVAGGVLAGGLLAGELL